MWDTDRVVIDLGSLGSGELRYGINDDGTVVGLPMMRSGGQRAFVWTGGMLFDLNDIVDDVDWSFTAAYAVNASGQIVGTGYYKGVSSAFRLDPIQAGFGRSLSDESALLTCRRYRSLAWLYRFWWRWECSQSAGNSDTWLN